MRRVVLTAEQADDLENEVTSYVADHGYEAKYAKRYLKDLGAPPEVAQGLLTRVDEVLHLVTAIESEPSQRDLYESVVDAYGRLDKYLDKSFRVVGKRRGARKPFAFHVG
jgi:hypothetical protein